MSCSCSCSCTYHDTVPDMPLQLIVQFCKSYDLYHKCSCMCCHRCRKPHAPQQLLPPHPAAHRHSDRMPYHPRDIRFCMLYNAASYTDPPHRSDRSDIEHHCSSLCGISNEMRLTYKMEKKYCVAYYKSLLKLFNILGYKKF